MFDRFAEVVAAQVARAWFFCACVLMILLWAPSLLLFGKVDTWQLVINTATTIVTFLLVALLQNTEDRSKKALNHKLDAIIGGLVEVIEQVPDIEATECVDELRRMAGVEMEQSK